MSLGPTITERLARARADLRMGVPVLLVEGNVTALAIAVETMSAERLEDLFSVGTPVLSITKHRAETLKVRAYDGDIARIDVPKGADIGWVQAIADPADDLLSPMKGPLRAIRDGSADLNRTAVILSKAARLLPAVVTVVVEKGFAAKMLPDLTRVDVTLANADLLERSPLREVVSAKVPLRVSEAARLHVFRPEDGGEEHYAIEIGRPDRNSPVLTRLHSACFTGDLLGSLKCDCGPQLDAALVKLGKEGAGILLYLNQEGRGIGLVNKMRAYSLQDQGFDTVEANHRLGFEDDERDFRIGSDILTKLGFSSVRLLTNNPAKVDMLAANGIAVTERVPLKVGLNPLNAKYLDTKAKKSGHIL